MLRRPLAALIPVVAVLALAPPASAHNISLYPRYGEVGDSFFIRGWAWQPFRRIRWRYDESDDGSIDQRGSFFPNRFGRFTFTWRNADGGTHKLCFRQFDTRRRYQRPFRKCRRFTAIVD